jgi:hypothetical protein
VAARAAPAFLMGLLVSYVFFVLSLERRRMVHVNVSEHSPANGLRRMVVLNKNGMVRVEDRERAEA